jgi:hypothetical protein
MTDDGWRYPRVKQRMRTKTETSPGFTEIELEAGIYLLDKLLTLKDSGDFYDTAYDKAFFEGKEHLRTAAVRMKKKMEAAKGKLAPTAAQVEAEQRAKRKR